MSTPSYVVIGPFKAWSGILGIGSLSVFNINKKMRLQGDGLDLWDLEFYILVIASIKVNIFVFPYCISFLYGAMSHEMRP